MRRPEHAFLTRADARLAPTKICSAARASDPARAASFASGRITSAKQIHLGNRSVIAIGQPTKMTRTSMTLVSVGPEMRRSPVREERVSVVTMQKFPEGQADRRAVDRVGVGDAGGVGGAVFAVGAAAEDDDRSSILPPRSLGEQARGRTPELRPPLPGFGASVTVVSPPLRMHAGAGRGNALFANASDTRRPARSPPAGFAFEVRAEIEHA